MNIIAVITLSLALTSAPLLINRLMISLWLNSAAQCKGVLPYYKPWMRFLNNNNNMLDTTSSHHHVLYDTVTSTHKYLKLLPVSNYYSPDLCISRPVVSDSPMTIPREVLWPQHIYSPHKGHTVYSPDQRHLLRRSMSLVHLQKAVVNSHFASTYGIYLCWWNWMLH